MTGLRLRQRLQAKPIAHRDGTQSERIAAVDVTESGTRESQVLIVAKYVSDHPGQTALGIAAKTKLDRYQVSRRLADAEHLGLVHKGEPVIREVWRPQSTWWPGEAASVPAAGGVVQGELL